MAEADKLGEPREALDSSSTRRGSGDEFALATFAGGQTADRRAVHRRPSRRCASRSAPGSPRAPPASTTRWPGCPRSRSSSGSAKRAAVLVTDGVDNASAIGPEQARKLVRRPSCRSTCWRWRRATPTSGAPSGEDYRYADLLHLLAEATGGRYYALADPGRGAPKPCAAILGDLRHQYVLGFSSPATGPSTYHPIRVEVRNGRRRVGPSFTGGATAAPRRPSRTAARAGFPCAGLEPAVHFNDRRSDGMRWKGMIVLAVGAGLLATRLRHEEVRQGRGRSRDGCRPHPRRRPARAGRGGQTRIKEHDEQIATASRTAQEALQRAQEAGKLAEGKLLYETVLSDDKVKFGFDKSASPPPPRRRSTSSRRRS